LCIVSLCVLGSFLSEGGVNRRTDLRHPFSHDIPKPYAYRWLPRAAVSCAIRLVPEPAETALARWAHGHPQVAKLCDRFGWDAARLSDLLATSAVLLIALLGFAVAIAHLVGQLYITSPQIRLAASFGAVAALPMMFGYMSYVYDLPYLALYTAALGLRAARRWLGYSLFLAMNTLTKETALLLILVFALHYYRSLPRKLFAALLAAQLVIYISLTALVRLFFHSNPGQPLEFHLGHNLTMPPFAWGNAMAFGVLAVAVLRDWHEKPAFLRHGVWSLVPLLAMCFFWGLLDEYRDYYEVYAIVFLLVFHAAVRCVRCPNFRARAADSTHRYPGVSW